MFAGGNVVYAVLGILPRTDYKLRVWIMLVARRTPPPRQDNNDDISICLLLMDFPERTSLSLNNFP